MSSASIAATTSAVVPAAPIVVGFIASTLACRFVPFPHRATAGATFGALWNMCVRLHCLPEAPIHILRIYLSFRANDDSSLRQPLGGNA